jgi:hypothetical protein
MTPAQREHIHEMAVKGGQAAQAARRAKHENAFGKGGAGEPVARRTPTARPATENANPNNLARRDGPQPMTGPSVPASVSGGRGASKARTPHLAVRHTPAGHMGAPRASTTPRAHAAQPVARPPAHAPKAPSHTTHKPFAGMARGKGK